jgi:hypothetical protein
MNLPAKHAKDAKKGGGAFFDNDYFAICAVEFSPSPQPSPAGRGRILRCAADFFRRECGAEVLEHGNGAEGPEHSIAIPFPSRERVKASFRPNQIFENAFLNLIRDYRVWRGLSIHFLFVLFAFFRGHEV